MEPNTTSVWLELARQGDPEAQREIWDQFFPQLVSLAKKRLGSVRRTDADEEDVALSVLNSFFSGAAENRFPDLRGSDNLWRLLSWMTHRKAIDRLRHQARQRRASLGESAFGAFKNPDGQGMAGIEDPNPTPDLEVLFIEELKRLLESLPIQMREIATLKLDGHTNQEIAENQKCSLATIERRLKMIREIWRSSGDAPIQRPHEP